MLESEKIMRRIESAFDVQKIHEEIQVKIRVRQ